MSRPYRLEMEDAYYHVIVRGNNRRKIFGDDEHKKKILEIFKKGKVKYKYRIFAYVIMDNHYHLFIQTLKANLSKTMHYINTAYSTYYNWKNRCRGHVFQGRYKSILVDTDEYFKELTRYIHRNSVRVKIVKNPWEYRWSSCREYLRGGRNGLIVPQKEILGVLGMKAEEYKNFVAGKEKDIKDNVYGNMILGGVGFVKKTLDDFKVNEDSREFYRKNEIKNVGIKMDDVVDVVSEYYEEDKKSILKERRCFVPRKVCIYLCYKSTQAVQSEIGRVFNIKGRAVGKVVEDVDKMLEKDINLGREMKDLNYYLRV